MGSHGDMSRDPVFGRFQKELRKVASIASPGQYHQIFEHHAEVLRWGH